MMGCFAASGPALPAIFDGTMNLSLSQKFLKENVRPSVHDLALKSTSVLQQDKHPKHSNKSALLGFLFNIKICYTDM